VEHKIDANAVYMPSKDVVARVIENEIIIVPLVSGIGDLEDDLYTLNEIGRAVWDKLDGHKTINDIVAKLAEEYQGPIAEIEKDVTGFVKELVKRGIVSPRDGNDQ